MNISDSPGILRPRAIDTIVYRVSTWPVRRSGDYSSGALYCGNVTPGVLAHLTSSYGRLFDEVRLTP